jgi:O-antigen/teichoic acid export membrane protein
MTLSNEKKETIAVASLAFSANIVGKFISMPIGIVVASILGPSDYGLLAIVNMILQYLSYLNLGFLTNITREVPIAYGKGDLKEVELVYSTVFTNFTITTILGLVVLGIAYSLGYDFNGEILPIYLLLIVLIKIAAYADSYFHAYVKGEGKFMIYGQYEMVIKVAVPIMNLILVYYFQLLGMLISLAMTHVVGTLFAYIRLGKPVLRFILNLKKSRELMSTGILMYLNKIIDGVFISISVILAGSFLTREDVGILSFALVIASTGKVPFADILTMMLRRKMAVDGGKYGVQNYPIFKKYFGDKLVIYAILMTTVMAIYVLFYSISVRIFLHKFEASIPIFLILYFAVNYYNIRNFMYAYFNVTMQMNKRSAILLLGIAVNLALGYTAVKMNYGILGIAASTSIAFIVVSLNTIFITFKQIFPNTLKRFTFIFKLSLISALLTGLLYLFRDMMIFQYQPDPTRAVEMIWATLDFIVKALFLTVLSFGLYLSLFRDEKAHIELIKIASHLTDVVKRKTRNSR